jgi:hypothetical protein
MGVNAAIDALVFGFFDGGVEAFVEFVDAPVEDVELGAAFMEAAGDLDEADGFGGVAVFKVHDDFAFGVDGELAMAPLAFAIHLGAFFDAPRGSGGFGAGGVRGRFSIEVRGRGWGSQYAFYGEGCYGNERG